MPVENQENEDLIKSIDAQIDALFAEDEAEVEEVVKADMIKDDKPAKTTADAAVGKAPKGEKDESRGAGRPKQISGIPQTDTDGKRSGEYDGDITEKKTEKDGKKAEDSQTEPPADMKKSLSESEWAEFEAFKKAKAEAAQEENLRKARAEQTDLIKSAVLEAIKPVQEKLAEAKAENEELKKSLTEQGDLIKSMANKPQRSKAITNVNSLEKSFGGNGQAKGSEKLSKSELLDIAEDLVKSKAISVDQAIELEQTGYIYEPDARQVFENEVRKRNR